MNQRIAYHFSFHIALWKPIVRMSSVSSRSAAPAVALFDISQAQWGLFP
jgi:hypothetical protein